MDELKLLSLEAVPRALEKAERYRLLNEPNEAQSICLDVLAVDPDNQQALTTMILTLTEQFERDPSLAHEALATIDQLHGEYERAYYKGLVLERRAKARLAHRTPRGGARAYEWLVQAMDCFEAADALRPQNNEDAKLRWNACVRLMARHPELAPMAEEPHEPLLSE
jgi:hypothetical protein